MRKPHTLLRTAAILAGALLIAGITGAGNGPPVTTTGPEWLAGPGGQALETVIGDVAALPARPDAALARKLSADVANALNAPMPQSGAGSYEAGLRRWQQSASLMLQQQYAAATADLKAGTSDVSAVTTGIKAATGTTMTPATSASGGRGAAKPANAAASPSLWSATPVYYVYGAGLQSFAIAPDSLRNLYLMFVEIDPSTSVTVTSVSSSRVSWTRAVQVYSGGKDFEIWTGIPTSLGDSAVSFAFSGSVSKSNVETGRQQFQSSLATPHWTVTGSWDAYPWGNTIIYPALHVAPGGGYWAYGKTTNVGSAGSTPGFSYDVTPQANVVAYSTSAVGLVSPTAPTLPGSGTSVGVSVSAS
jgi:hypothetical protein